MNAGFYKLEGDSISYQGNKLITPDGTFLVSEHEQYSYPLFNGWLYFASYEEAETYFNAEINESEKVPMIDGVPQKVNKARALIVLDSWGKLDTLNQMMTHADTPAVTKLAFQYEPVISRQSPLVNQLAFALGLSNEKTDELFVLAHGIDI